MPGAGHLIKTILKQVAYRRHIYVVTAPSLLFGNLAINS